MQNGGMLLILLLLLIYTFGGTGSLTSENLTLIVLALSFLVAGNDSFSSSFSSNSSCSQ